MPDVYKRPPYFFFFLGLLFSLLLSLEALWGQQVIEKESLDYPHDSSYYETFPGQLTSRFYFSQKYTNIRYSGGREGYPFIYRPNTTLNMGVGATYKWATLNLAYGWPFLNPDRGQGKTRYLDLQMHAFGPKFNLDLFGQFYRGFFLSQQGLAASGPDQFYVRPDIRTNIMGGTWQYIFNHRKFSFPAAFINNQWQKKSAGTWLFGIESFFGVINADSTMIPTEIDPQLAENQETHTRFFEFGPSIGYAHTLVIRQRFFLMASPSFGLGIGGQRYGNDGQYDNRWGVYPNYLIRSAIGYNSDTYAFSLTYVNSSIQLVPRANATRMNFDTGNVRVNFVRRFVVSKKYKEYLKIIP